jgi:hypothetical protein
MYPRRKKFFFIPHQKGLFFQPQRNNSRRQQQRSWSRSGTTADGSSLSEADGGADGSKYLEARNQAILGLKAMDSVPPEFAGVGSGRAAAAAKIRSSSSISGAHQGKRDKYS